MGRGQGGGYGGWQQAWSRSGGTESGWHCQCSDCVDMAAVGIANFAWRKTCFGCHRPKQAAMYPPACGQMGSHTTRNRNRRRGRSSGVSEAVCVGRNGDGSATPAVAAPAAARAAPVQASAGSAEPAQDQGTNARGSAAARTVAHLGLPLPKVGDLEKRLTKPTLQARLLQQRRRSRPRTVCRRFLRRSPR